uniref:CDK5 regulatory subunit-associated protein 3-like n=1 Tax=Styela clava TaxID=7725 RepID=UPI001939B117|nr:CDK5 regulatory subunit-associated protein 3-like [Styela clava]
MSNTEGENLLPIDIQCTKLVDWLIDRRHCNIKWQTSAEVVKEKISNALQDMPSTPEMKKLLEGSCFHYFKCKKIVDVLRDTEKDSKNIFGLYSSQRMKDWQEIVKLYEKENLYLAELSSRLLRNLNYEIPSIKRQRTKCEQIQEECSKKEQDCIRNANEARRLYKVECKKIGITGDHVKNELLDLVKNLPNEFNDIAEKVKEIESISEFYATFVEFTLESDQFKNSITPLLNFISQNGNATVYQWRTGNVPSKIVHKDAEICKTELEEDQGGEIDWGAIDDVPVPDEIDFGIELDDTGIGEITLETAGEEEPKNEENGFEIVESESKSNWDIEEITVEEVPNGSAMLDEGTAIGDDAMTVLENLKTRTLFVNELIELKGFLSQRAKELAMPADVLSINQFQSAPALLQMRSLKDMQTMESKVTSIYDSLTSTRMTHLCRILGSPRYVDRLIDTLKRQLALVDKHQSIKLEQIKRRSDAVVEQRSLQPKLKALIEETKAWQKLIEDDISKRYKTRPIHLLGTINQL